MKNKKILFVCGWYDEGAGKPSSFCNTLLEENVYQLDTVHQHEIDVLNGGNIDSLASMSKTVSLRSYDRVIWWPNVDNKHEKLLGNITHSDLIISKNNRDLSYNWEDYKNRIESAKASGLVEFYKKGGEVYYAIYSKGFTSMCNHPFMTDMGALVRYIFRS